MVIKDKAPLMQEIESFVGLHSILFFCSVMFVMLNVAFLNCLL
jgi:hypothetical protein